MSTGLYADSEPVSGPVPPITICVAVTPGWAAWPRAGRGNGEQRGGRRDGDERAGHRETAFWRTDSFSVIRPIVIDEPGWTSSR